MDDKTVLTTSNDGSIEYLRLQKGLLEEAIKVMQESFYVNENVCVALGLPHQPESFGEMDLMLKWAAKDGISIAAIDKETGKVVGASFNKFQEAETSEFYPKYIKSCQHNAAKNVAKWMQDMGKIFDIFEYCKVKSGVEIMFVGILPEYRRRGIAKKLFEVSIDVARGLNRGEDVRISIDEEALEVAPPPEIVTAICTSFVTQKIAEDLKFKRAKEFSFSKFVYDGVALESRVPSGTDSITYEYVRL
ncbi:uncharacterized protein [Euwallacea fornicatus]|uniref:uncharacterized protein n=1 Tax=Euwallacea fornicatus TaxID=995702 RepID=UPI00338EC99E